MNRRIDAMHKLPSKYRAMVEEVSDEGSEVFFYLKPGWTRDDGVHHVSYETAYHPLADVMDEFKRLRRCQCDECGKST